MQFFLKRGVGLSRKDECRRPLSSAPIYLILLLISACGGGGGSGQPAGSGPTQPPPPPPPPVGEVNFTQSTYEVSESTTTVEFMVTRSGGSAGEVTIDITTGDGTALAGQDYGSITTTATFGDGGTGSKTGGVVIFDDNDDEGDETFELTLVNATGGVAIGAVSTATVTIRDDDGSTPAPISGNYLNDTGVTGCATSTSAGDPCGASTSGFPDQDAQFGRDTIANDDSDGRAGFSFAKLDANGVALANQSTDYGTTPWSCVEDNVTGLIWEIKTDVGGVHHNLWTYTWQDGIALAPLAPVGNGDCEPTLANCNTYEFVRAVNELALCGYADWRVPTRHELLSILDFGAATSPMIDTNYFPNTLPAAYWTSSTQESSSDEAWAVTFNATGVATLSARLDLTVRLVRGGF